MLNRVVLMGRLTRDPELRTTTSGTPVASFTLAVDRAFSRGEERQVDFIDIVAWRNSGEFASKYFRKGQLVAVEGRLQARKWEDKDGNKRTNYEVVADGLHFAERKADGSAPQQYSPPPFNDGDAPPVTKSAPKSSSYAELDDDDDDGLPF